MAFKFASRNLIVNGDAETGPVAQDWSADVAPQGWTSTGTMTAVVYAAGGGSDLNLADAVTAQGGTAYFAGGSSAPVSTARQEIDVSDFAARIDAGRAGMVLAAQTSGYLWQDDHATIEVKCRAADGNLLGTLTLNGVLHGDRFGATDLVNQETAGGVFAGTRTLEVVLTMTRVNGLYNDGYADNISLHLVNLTRGQVQIDASGDYSAVTTPSTGVSFMAQGDGAAMLSSAQFGTTFTARPLIEGSPHLDGLFVAVEDDAVFSAAAWRFGGWSDGVDVLRLDGGDGAEKITGSAMSDQLMGGLGADTLIGGGGSDGLDGGQGVDLLRGGLGADQFILADRAADRDVIADFSAGDHLVAYADAFAGAGLVAGAGLGAAFLANATGLAESAEDRFIYDTVAGRLYYDVDGLGGHRGVLVAMLQGLPGLTEGDFLVL